MEELENIVFGKYRRRSGMTEDIAKRAGVTRQTVRSVIKGRWRNDKVVAAALEVLEEYKKTEMAFKERAEKIN